MKNGLYRYKVYYFVGDFYSSKGEIRKSTVVWARDENEAEYIAKRSYPNAEFGWVEPYHTSRN